MPHEGSHVQLIIDAVRGGWRARGLRIASLAGAVDVSPRAVAEFERRGRPHLPLDAVIRHLASVGRELVVAGADPDAVNAVGRARRAAHRWRNVLGRVKHRHRSSQLAPILFS